MKQDMPKNIKRDLRSLVRLAHEAELRKALEDLHADFERWKSGEIDSFDMADLVHKFHDGPNRELHSIYQ